jgi:lipopolysaccharide transport system ATP-binding protein
MTTVIKVENLSKKYILNHKNQTERYTALRDIMTTSIKNIFQKEQDLYSHQEEFWALKDVSFEIKQGDRVGIVGRNGAGKSTLLKILSRIVEPTSGRVSLKGRVASLLEVGTGFHPELTGRENIFLNGAILGMKRHEIQRKFDEIVSFAEIEKFLDTPVKAYSSGMYVRLAFSVAAHLEPDILIVDEVLAVGDAQFQKKCMGKMEDVGRDGRTVLFVSHNMNTISSLCEKAILVANGKIRDIGETKDVIKNFSSSSQGFLHEITWTNSKEIESNDWFSIKSMRLAYKDGSTPTSALLSRSEEVYLEIVGETTSLDSALTIGYNLCNENSESLYWSYHTDSAELKSPKIKVGTNKLLSRLPLEILNEGKYFIEPIGGLHFIKWLYEPGKTSISLSFEVFGGLSESPLYQHSRPTMIAPILLWSNSV